ncbi:MAG TPA: hypothetical protein VEH27_07320 [Methylomirabilota bacterium]|nr:hypothetical protein [Methylomirabilota bacterium]
MKTSVSVLVIAALFVALLLSWELLDFWRSKTESCDRINTSAVEGSLVVSLRALELLRSNEVAAAYLRLQNHAYACGTMLLQSEEAQADPGIRSLAEELYALRNTNGTHTSTMVERRFQELLEK